MDFIKGNEQIKIDPNGIDISGAGHIIIDSEKIIGDISLNGKVSITDDFDITGNTVFNGNIEISGNDNFVITNSSKVGIGTSIPLTELHIHSTGNPKVRFSDNQPNAWTTGFFQFCSNGHSVDYGQGQYTDVQITGNSGGISFQSQKNNESAFYMLNVLANGFVGIGTTNPTSKLDVNGKISTQDSLEIGPINDMYKGLTITKANIKMVIGNSGEPDNYPSMQVFKNVENVTPTENSDKYHMVIQPLGGNVGIGTGNPNYPLHVSSMNTGNLNVSHAYFNVAAQVGTVNGYNREISAWFNGHIVAKEFLAVSDSRIKTDISLVVDDTALQQVNQLENYQYHYIDPLRRRPTKTIGFIAQDVKEVIPNAVSIEKNYVPDEMRIIAEPVWREDASKVYLDIPDLDMSGAFTGKAKFYVSNDPSGNDGVCKEVEIKEVPATAMNEFSTTPYVAEFDESWNNVFFYGKEVSDFHTIDKAQIFALHHSAIQELDRKHKREVEEKNNKIENLEQNISGLNSQVSSLTSRLEALEASVLALQNN